MILWYLIRIRGTLQVLLDTSQSILWFIVHPHKSPEYYEIFNVQSWWWYYTPSAPISQHLTVLFDWSYNVLVKDENNYNSKLLKVTIGAVLESTAIRIRFVYESTPIVFVLESTDRNTLFVYESTGIVRFRIDCYKNKIRLWVDCYKYSC